MDKNGNGFLTKKEIKNHLKAAPWAQPYITAESFHWAALWEKFEIDGDGQVSREEFATLYEQDLWPLFSQRASSVSAAPSSKPQPAQVEADPFGAFQEEGKAPPAMPGSGATVFANLKKVMTLQPPTRP